MRARIFIIGWLWAILTAITPAWAQVQVSARVDRSTLSAGESLQLEVRVSGGEGAVDISPITDFKVHSQSTSTSVQIINSKMTKEMTYHFVLMHQRKGNLTIPPLTVAVDGQKYQTKPIRITVKDAAATGKADPSRDKEIWVAADLSDIAPFTSQQITYVFRLYTTVQLDEAKFQTPEFSGFSVKEIKDRNSYRKLINGREHAVTEVYFVLTPLSPGKLTIDAASLHVGIVRQDRRRRRSPFDSFFRRNVVEPRVLQTEPITIAVRPLPPLPQQKTFSGLVGSFDISAEMETTDLKVGDSATLTITLEGKGNIMDAQAPSLELPAEFKSYSDHPEEEIQLERTGTKGKKVFRTALVPVAQGEFSLPPIEFTYFDTEKGAYHTLKTEVPILKVAADAMAQKAPVTITPDSGTLQKKKVAFTGRDILPPKENLAAIKSKTHLAWPIFLLTIVGPVLIFGCATMVQKMRRPDNSATAQMKAKSRKAIRKAPYNTGNEFLSSLYQALTAAIFAAAGRIGEALTWKEAETLLLEKNYPKKDAANAAKLLADIESYKFSGTRLSDNQHRQLLNRTRKMVRRLAQ